MQLYTKILLGMFIGMLLGFLVGPLFVGCADKADDASGTGDDADDAVTYYDDIEPSAGVDVLDFTINFVGTVAATTEDQLYTLTLNVVGDNTVLLDTLDIVVLVPGTAY